MKYRLIYPQKPRDTFQSGWALTRKKFSSRNEAQVLALQKGYKEYLILSEKEYSLENVRFQLYGG